MNRALKDHARFVTFFKLKVAPGTIFVAVRKELHILKDCWAIVSACSSGLGVLVFVSVAAVLFVSCPSSGDWGIISAMDGLIYSYLNYVY